MTAGSGVRRPGLALVAALALVASLAACSPDESGGGDTGAGGAGGDLVTFTAAGGEWTEAGGAITLTLFDVAPSAVVFTDRPQRSTATMLTAELVGRWEQLYGTDNPNAAVTTTGGHQGAEVVAVELSDPALDVVARTATFSVTPLEPSADLGGLAHLADRVDAALPSAFGHVAVFIDNASVGPAVPAASDVTCAEAPDVALNGTPVTMAVTNHSAVPADQVYVAVTGVTAVGYDSWATKPSTLMNDSIALACLPQDPGDTSGRTYLFELGEGVAGGLLWVSLGEPIPSGAGGLPTVQPSFDTSLYRFANIEFAYPGQGDMTNVDQFSFPVGLSVFAPGATSPSAGTSYSGTTCEIVADLQQAVASQGDNADWAQVRVTDANGDFVRVLAPKQRARQPDVTNGVPNPFRQGWPSMLAYVQSMAGRQVTVEGLFTPASSNPNVDQTGWFSYAGSFDADGNVTLNGTIGAPVANGPGNGGRPGEQVTMQASSQDVNADGTVVGLDGIAAGIYDQNSQYSVGGVNRNGFTNGEPDPAAPDDVYNSLYRDFITAFTYGYWGGRYGDNARDFWYRFDPPFAPEGGQEAFAAARSGADGFVAWNLWAEVLFGYSTNYAIPYGEDFGSGAPNRPSPLLDVPVGGRWQMTIGSDGPAGCLDKL